jgi:transcriptional regulator with XRE-family HTH domain
MTQRGADAGRNEDDTPEWADQVMATVAAEVRRRRRELGMSGEDLARACADLGYAVPRNVIANMESGRRAQLPLVEVIVLAEALHVAPICLIYPVGLVDRVQALPDEEPTDTFAALQWFTGERGFLDGASEALRRRRAEPRRTWSLDAEGNTVWSDASADDL